jgi:NAD(P)-dependent dehydrogenase (short-subunit alcohol dehydrogenase family)
VILEGSVALVAGGAGGLGAATVRRLVQRGARVVVFDRDADAVVGLTGELATGSRTDDHRAGDGRAGVFGAGAGVVGVVGKVASDDDIARAIDAATALGPLSVLVNAAGGGGGGPRTVGPDGTPHDKDRFVRTIDANAVGTFNVCRLVAASMAGNHPDDDGQRGVIVNTASIAATDGQLGQVAYAAAKAAIVGMTLPMARDLAPIGVRVCTIAPGVMGTPAMHVLRPTLEVDPAADAVFPPRMGEPDEFAALVEAIVVNPYLNGETIRMDAAARLAGVPRSAV